MRYHFKFPDSKNSYSFKWLDITADLSKNDFCLIKSPDFWGECTDDYLPAGENYSYALFYLNVTKGIGKHLEAFVGVDNLFDKKVNDLEMPVLGAFYYGGLRINF